MMMPCDERALSGVIEEGMVEAAERGIGVCVEELAASARTVLTRAFEEGNPLTDIELLAVLATYLGNRGEGVR